MIDAALKQFRDAAISKGDFATPASLDHKLHGQMSQAATILLSGSSEGREAFSSLLEDDSPHVRGWAAAQLLSEGDLRGLPVMESLSNESGIGAFTAKVTLDEFRAGRLDSPFGIKKKQNKSCEATGDNVSS